VLFAAVFYNVQSVLVMRGWAPYQATGIVVTVAASFLFLLPEIRALIVQLPKLTSAISQPSDAQVLLLARQIKSSGSNVERSLELLQGFTDVSFSEMGHGESSAVRNFELFEAIYLEVQAVISRATRKHHQCVKNGKPMAPHPNKLSQDYFQRIALLLYEKCPTDACRARTISICNHGTNNDTVATQSLELALRLLHSGVQPPSIQSYHATLSVCVTAKDWKKALYLVQNEMTNSATTLSWNIVFTALSRAKQGYEAHQLLHKLIGHQLSKSSFLNAAFAPPDRNTFHFTMNALINAVNSRVQLPTSDNNGTTVGSNIDTAYKLLNSMLSLDQWYALNREQYLNLSVLPNDATFDLLLSAYGRNGEWDKVKFVSQVHQQYQRIACKEDFTFPDMPAKRVCEKVSLDPSDPNSFSSMRIRWENEGMIKRTNEKFWKIGTFSDPMVPFDFTVALQPNRNPSKNGIKLLLYNGSALNATKVGYLIMINRLETMGTRRVGISTLLGVYLDPLFRQCGLSKIMIAIWLALCHHANAVPRTGVMNKPLLALVLQHTFQFVPEDSTKYSATHGTAVGRGVIIEISPGANASIGVYSSNMKCLQGAFSLRDMKRENIFFLTEPSTPRGRLCRIGTTFIKQSARIDSLRSNGSIDFFDEIVEQQLLGKTRTGSLKLDRSDLCWEHVLFGDETGKIFS
jgi:PPR repeat